MERKKRKKNQKSSITTFKALEVFAMSLSPLPTESTRSSPTGRYLFSKYLQARISPRRSQGAREGRPPVTSRGRALSSLTPARTLPEQLRPPPSFPSTALRSAGGACLSSGRPGDEQAPVKCDRTRNAESVLPAGAAPGPLRAPGHPRGATSWPTPGTAATPPAGPRSSFPGSPAEPRAC